MEIKDFEITQIGAIISGIKHKDYPNDTAFFWVDEEMQLDILDKASAFVNGETKAFKVWSDYDFDEPSENVFIAVDKYSGLVYNLILDYMEGLICFLWDENFDVYEIVVDNNLH